jgi:hypothetical protein
MRAAPGEALRKPLPHAHSSDRAMVHEIIIGRFNRRIKSHGRDVVFDELAFT